MLFPEGASCLASVPPPAPLPTMMTSKRLSMPLPLQPDAAVHDAAIGEDGSGGVGAPAAPRGGPPHPAHLPTPGPAAQAECVGRVRTARPVGLLAWACRPCAPRL